MRPGAVKSKIMGVRGNALNVKISAPPVKGKASPISRKEYNNWSLSDAAQLLPLAYRSAGIEGSWPMDFGDEKVEKDFFSVPEPKALGENNGATLPHLP